MRRRSSTFAAALLALFVASCGGRATQIVLHLDSNAPPERPMTLSIVSRVGSPTIREIYEFQGQLLRLNNNVRPIFPGSVGLLPEVNGPRNVPLTVWAVLELPASAGRPAVRVERLQRLQLIERVPQQARIFFNVACAAPASGCRLVSPERCTVSTLCLENGETCGDEGVCIPVTLPMQPIAQLDAAAAFDVATRADVPVEDVRDAEADRPDVADVLNSGRDAQEDGGMDAPDAATDARVDSGIDSGIDVRVDTGVDVRSDSGVDTGVGPTTVRLVAPMSTSRVAAVRPTLEFELPFNATDAQIELCADRAMSMGCSTFVNTTGSARVPVARPAGWTFWQVTPRRMGTPLTASPVWQFYVGSRGAGVDSTIGKVMDLNGDGRSDLVIASLGTETVAIYYGIAAGFPSMPNVTLTAPSGSSEFGNSVDAAGDIDGDGFGDLVVGAPGSGAGQAFVYLGRGAGVATTPRFTFAGVDAADRFGAAVAGAGDVNRDGYGDLIIGAPTAGVAGVGNAGTATIFLGRDLPSAPVRSTVLLGGAAGDRFGIAVAGGGDCNADGFTEVVVGADRADPMGRLDGGEAYVHFGRATGIRVMPDVPMLGTAAGDNFGRAVAMIGDYNGDGAADLLVGAPRGSTQGATRIAFGAVMRMLFPTNLEFTGPIAMSRDGFGTSVAGVGDLNGDGFTDFAVGAPLVDGAGTTRGAVGVCLGRAVVDRVECSVIVGTANNDRLGDVVAGIGDSNNDGFDDVLAGSPAATRAGLSGAGYVRFYRGAATAAGVSATHSREIAGRVANERLGQAIGTSVH